MKKFFLLLCTVFTAASLMAQLELPQPSPAAKIMQRAGLTDITIEYSSPGANDREIWGGLVPYDEMWRAGANNPTNITFSRDVKIGGTDIKAGTYALYVTPKQSGPWSITLNSDKNAQPWSRKTENDAVTVMSEAKNVTHHERLQYSVTDFGDDKAVINMAWANRQVSFTVGLATADQALASINRAANNSWRESFNAARYLTAAGEQDLALQHINTSLMLNENWFNTWIKASILNKKGMVKEAYEAAQKAMDLGNQNPDTFWYKADVEEALKTWRKS